MLGPGLVWDPKHSWVRISLRLFFLIILTFTHGYELYLHSIEHSGREAKNREHHVHLFAVLLGICASLFPATTLMISCNTEGYALRMANVALRYSLHLCSCIALPWMTL